MTMTAGSGRRAGESSRVDGAGGQGPLPLVAAMTTLREAVADAFSTGCGGWGCATERAEEAAEVLAILDAHDCGVRDRLTETLTDETMRGILMVLPPPADFASYSATVRERIIAAMAEPRL